MATIRKTPGLKFFAEHIDPPTSPCGIEDFPRRNELYVVCKDGSIQSVYEPSLPIGWELIDDGEEWFYCATQMNHPRKRCSVRYHSRTEDPPAGRGGVETSQEAAVTEQKEDGEEVESQLESISKLDPLLAHCAVLVGDPVQTTAMAKFAEGKMSYAEMRGLCG